MHNKVNIFFYSSPMYLKESIAEYLPPIRDHIHTKFPSAAKRQANKLKINDQAPKRANTGWITIDWSESKDLDDGIFLEKLINGNYYLEVSISDVAEAIHPITPIDVEAMSRCTSVYYKTHNIPMIPRCLSENHLSLLWNTTRNTLTFALEIDSQWNVYNKNIFESKFTNTKRYDYESFWEDFSNPDNQNHNMLQEMYQLAKILERKRVSKWAIDFNEAERILQLDNPYYHQWSKNVASDIIREFMILTNIESAKYCYENEIDAIMRNHMPEMEWKNVQLCEKAYYDNKMVYHRGLAVRDYSHYTSPIRRYVDLVNHRQIKQHIRWEKLVYTPHDISLLADHTNVVVSNILTQQRNIIKSNWLNRLGRDLQKDWKLSIQHQWYKKRIENHIELDSKLPDHVVRNIVAAINESQKIDTWMIQNFLDSKETQIIEAIYNKVFEWSWKFKWLINTLNATNDYIDIHENITTSFIEITFYYNGKEISHLSKDLEYSSSREKSIAIHSIREKSVNNIFEFFIKKSKKRQ